MKHPFWTEDPWPNAHCTIHFGSLPTMCSLAFSTMTHAWRCLHIQSQGYVLMSLDPKVRKNNYLFRHQGEESLTPPHLFHVCIYSCVAEGRLPVCFCHIFWLCFALSLARSLSAWGRRQMVGDTTGWGADTVAQLSVCFPSFLSLFFTLSLSLLFLPNLPLSPHLLSVFFSSCKSLTLC